LKSQVADAHQRAKLPWWVQPLTSVVTTGIMSCLVSGMATARTLGMDSVLAAPSHFMADWGRAFVLAWPLAWVIFTVVAPLVRRAIESLARASSARAKSG